MWVCVRVSACVPSLKLKAEKALMRAANCFPFFPSSSAEQIGGGPAQTKDIFGRVRERQDSERETNKGSHGLCTRCTRTRWMVYMEQAESPRDEKKLHSSGGCSLTCFAHYLRSLEEAQDPDVHEGRRRAHQLRGAAGGVEVLIFLIYRHLENATIGAWRSAGFSLRGHSLRLELNQRL